MCMVPVDHSILVLLSYLWGGGRGSGPATQLAKGYTSLLKKTLRKGLYFGLLYVLDYGKKGPFFRECQQFRRKGSFFCHYQWKRVIFQCFKSAFLEKKGSFSPQ